MRVWRWMFFVGQVNSSARHSIQKGHAKKSAILSLNRREFLSKAAATLFVIATLVIGPVATADDRGGWHWVASWATSPAAFFVYTAPVVQNQALAPAPARFATANIQPDLAFPFPDGSNRGATTQTLRSIVKPGSLGRRDSDPLFECLRQPTAHLRRGHRRFAGIRCQPRPRHEHTRDLPRGERGNDPGG